MSVLLHYIYLIDVLLIKIRNNFIQPVNWTNHQKIKSRSMILYIWHYICSLWVFLLFFTEVKIRVLFRVLLLNTQTDPDSSKFKPESIRSVWSCRILWPLLTLKVQPKEEKHKPGSGPGPGPDATTKACEVLVHLFKPLKAFKSAGPPAAGMQGCSWLRSGRDDLIPQWKRSARLWLSQVCHPARRIERTNRKLGRHGGPSVTKRRGGGTLWPQLVCPRRHREDDGGPGEDFPPCDSEGGPEERRDELPEEERAADAVRHRRDHRLHVGLHAERNSSVHTGMTHLFQQPCWSCTFILQPDSDSPAAGSRLAAPQAF